MSISSIGALNVQALNLISRLGTSSNSASSDDLITLLGSQSDSLSVSALGQWASRSQASNPFKTDFDNLGSLIASGDLEGAQKAYDAMQEKMQALQGTGDDPMGSDFAAIGAALSAGDTEAATTAWATLQTRLEAFSADRDTSNPLKKDMDQLGKLLEAGDLSGAQALFQTMQERMQTQSQPGSQSQQEDSFSSLLSALGSALASGDTSAAQEAWSKLDAKLQSGGAPPPPGDDQASSSSSSKDASTQVSELEAMLVSMYWQSSSLTNNTSNA